MDKQRFIPSMFHRRLVLLLAVVGVLALILTGQLFRLSVVEGAQRLADAEAKLDRRTYVPTVRGNFYDAKGRVLAIDRASYDVGVQYSVITGTWARERAELQARKKDLGLNRWLAMTKDAREAAIQERIPAWRGKIDRLWSEVRRLGAIDEQELQRRLDVIKASVQSTAASTWENQRSQEMKLYGIEDDDKYDFAARPIREQQQAHAILTRVPDAVAFEFRRIADEMPDMIEVQDSHRREYPWANAEVSLNRNSLPKPIRRDEIVNVPVFGIADHILGAIRNEVWEEDSERRPFRDPVTGDVDLGGYLPGDSVGSRGIERVLEDQLRGMRGEIRARRDTGEVIRKPPVPGADLHLTIDIALQARIQAIMSPQFGLTRVQGWHHNALGLGTALNSAAVVIEVETGEVVAMVSMPTLAMGQTMTAAQQLTSQPAVNRPVEAVYPPGSIIKPIVLAAAVTEGVQALGSPVQCIGHYFENQPKTARCWIYREKYGMATHGPLQAEEALARSCNIFFYTMADRLGIDRLCKWFHAFGMGQPLNVGLMYEDRDDKGRIRWLGENGGEVPALAEVRSKGDWKFNQVIMGIGQGPVTWTPMQAANAFATLARGGVIRDASIITNDPRGSRPQRCEDMHLNRNLVNAALEGLRQSVEEHHGTGHHIGLDIGDEDPLFNAVGVTVRAKTGTAQAPPLRWDSNNNGELDKEDQVIKDLDHSWVVGLVGPKNQPPLFAFAVIVEYGGSGGRCAGPIANQIVRALQSEGYLPGDGAAAQEKGTRASSTTLEDEGDH